MADTPTSRTLQRLRKEGWMAGVVEKWIAQTKRRKDLFGFIDVIACKPGSILAVQATSDSNFASRRTKILRETPHEAQTWLAGYGLIEVWGWSKQGRFWHPRIERITQEDFDAQREAVHGR